MIGLDPGLRFTGWGLIEVEGNRLHHIDSGYIASDSNLDISRRLQQIHDGLSRVFENHTPDEAAVEETFVNKNPNSTLKLGLARGIALVIPAIFGIPVAEYSANTVKKSIVGAGHATKEQMGLMVKNILPGCDPQNSDAADALALAICHAHFSETRQKWRKENY
ncbi:crossover junction endodeoxyribonuclease RuvC [Candidatus Poribacteria bacterium]|nr:crossover junction endodeoxyribonuclease RuvC [Alphaproteobacteria bacterium]MBR56413.1 crossover junction endodeoxyribonuclease RuvC [Candidatus Poribacteria bacterium]